MADLKKTHLFSLLILMWLSIVTLVMLLEALGSTSALNFSMESVLVVMTVGSLLFFVMLVIVRLLVNLMDGKSSETGHSRESVSTLLDAMTIAVDEGRNVYLLPRNSSKVIQVRHGKDGSEIIATDAFVPANMQAFRLQTDLLGNVLISPLQERSGQEERCPMSGDRLDPDTDNKTVTTH